MFAAIAFTLVVVSGALWWVTLRFLGVYRRVPGRELPNPCLGCRNRALRTDSPTVRIERCRSPSAHGCFGISGLVSQPASKFSPSV